MYDVEIFVDGACSGNPGVGGYGVIVRQGTKEIEYNGAEAYTTNNRMEVLGAIVALESLKSPSRVKVTSDSQYLVKGGSEWLASWIKNGWRNSKREPTPNKDLWLKVKGLMAKHDITWAWVKGHSGHIENERCDKLAKLAIKDYGLEL